MSDSLACVENISQECRDLVISSLVWCWKHIKICRIFGSFQVIWKYQHNCCSGAGGGGRVKAISRSNIQQSIFATESSGENRFCTRQKTSSEWWKKFGNTRCKQWKNCSGADVKFSKSKLSNISLLAAGRRHNFLWGRPAVYSQLAQRKTALLNRYKMIQK